MLKSVYRQILADALRIHCVCFSSHTPLVFDARLTHTISPFSHSQQTVISLSEASFTIQSGGEGEREGEPCCSERCIRGILFPHIFCVCSKNAFLPLYVHYQDWVRRRRSEQGKRIHYYIRTLFVSVWVFQCFNEICYKNIK